MPAIGDLVNSLSELVSTITSVGDPGVAVDNTYKLIDLVT
jgi:hypothetical protein